MNKVLITTEGGNVTSILTNVLNLKIVTIDYDKNADYKNDVSISDILEADSFSDDMFTLFQNDTDKQEKAVYNKLKQLNF